MRYLFLLTLLTAFTAFGGDSAFSSKPTATRSGTAVTIAFSVAAPTDVEVAVLAANGTVVRHLAAGVLGGKFPPPEPLTQGLSQSIVWDGNDDFGKTASGGQFRVRVRAGTGAKFGRFIGQDPYNFGNIDGLVVGEDGNLYVSGFGGPANECQKTLRVFSPEGKFIRTLLPFPADLPPGAMKEAAHWDEASKSWHPRNLNILNPEFYNSNNGYADYNLVAASKEGGVVLVNGGVVFKIDAQGAIPGSSFATGQKSWPVYECKEGHYGHPYYHQNGPTIFTASPDGKYLFMSGPCQNTKEKPKQLSDKFPLLGGVFRMKLDGKEEMQLFATIPATPDGPWSKDGGKNYGASGPVHGVCADLKGNAYVCDREKNRVVVFDQSGKQIGEIAVKNPDCVSVHPKTGAIYVIRRFCNGWGTHSMILDKFNNFESGATAVASFAKFQPRNYPSLAVTISGPRTILWMAGTAFVENGKPNKDLWPQGLVALEDTGAELKTMPLPYGPKPEGESDFARIATDRQHEEVYVSNGENLIYRYNGDTGEGGLLKKDGKVFYAPDLSVGYDGLLYVRSGAAYSGPLERLTRDLTPAPFSATKSNKLYDIYGRYGIGFCEKGVGVGPDGKVYDCWMYFFAKYFVSGWNADGLPLQGKYLANTLKTSGCVWKDVKLPDDRKVSTAIIGPVLPDNGGIRVDLKGNIYMGMRVQPKGFTAPAGYEKAPDYLGFTGSVVKFSPAGGALLGIADAESKDTAAPRLETNKGVCEGAMAIYPGVAPFSGGGYGGNSSCCVCRVSRFDLDSYGRLALPNVVSCSVKIVDNSGNLICEFGKYGNFDSQYVPDDSKDHKPIVATPDIPLAWPTGAGFTEKSVYVCDTYNRRVVRADFTWSAEATCDVK